MRDRKLTGPWAGFSFVRGELMTPEGKSFTATQLTWLALTSSLAREWSAMMDEVKLKTCKPQYRKLYVPRPPQRSTAANVIYLRDVIQRRQQERSSVVDGAGSADRTTVVRRTRGPRGPRRG
ncbi:DUF3653 domain-containing protein [Xanthomonas campestris]|uniref:DUF3653 domain-containing protein n=1 Tax=Xanthomonas campestris TaxID=339 RepID=UPI002B23E168|nr:DUF3653 domain-containing protein [Xanthomonas campestris]MEA9831451.1 DUF3653 domain-containing protein [Xanthomonas campestris pv. raphani]